jgi:hypothetical protein
MLHAVVTPVLMGLLFFGALMPVGLLIRLLGKDILHLRREAEAATYWVSCDGAGSRPDAMKDQF